MSESTVSFTVNPSRSPGNENVFVKLETTRDGAYGPYVSVFWLSRQDAFELGAQLAHAAEWLAKEAGE